MMLGDGMKETLLCYVLLLNNGLVSFDKYEEYLNTAFLENANNALLLELQFLMSDLRSTIRLIFEECDTHTFDKEYFGRLLLQELKDTYYLKSLSVNEFGKRAYSLWNDMPFSFSNEEPLHALSYADDPLSWGDVEQTCKLYEDLFEYYESHT